MQMYHKADETTLWRQGSEYGAGCAPLASPWASGATRHSPWSPAWPPSATPGRSPQCTTFDKSTWQSWTPQSSTKRISLGNWRAHPGKMPTCIDPGWVEVPTHRAQCHCRSCWGHTSPSSRYTVGLCGAGLSCSHSWDQVGHCRWLKLQ